MWLPDLCYKNNTIADAQSVLFFICYSLLLNKYVIINIKVIAIIVTATRAEKVKINNCNNIFSIISITSIQRQPHLLFSFPVLNYKTNFRFCLILI